LERLNVKKEDTFFKYWSAVFSIFSDMVDDDQDNAYGVYVELALQRSKDWSRLLLTAKISGVTWKSPWLFWWIYSCDRGDDVY